MLKHPAVPYVAPFAVFLAFLAIEKQLPGGPAVLYPLRVLVVSAVIFVFSSKTVTWKFSSLFGSIALGVAVFLIWVGPDYLFPGYRSHWLFENSITGTAKSSAPEALKSNLLFIVFRTLGCVALVPFLEEIFWRGWLMRWIINPDFEKVAPGAYSTTAFFVTAALFASEHGPYWEVGLICGLLYNWWMVRTKSLADCIVAHAVTNGLLSWYVLQSGQWQYWL